MNSSVKKMEGAVPLIAVAVLMVGACMDFYKVAHGTGSPLRIFSPAWLMLFLLFIFVCIVFYAICVLYFLGYLSNILKQLSSYRNQLKAWRWLIALFVLAFPVWFLQYTQWGIVFKGLPIRLLIWLATTLLLSFLITNGNAHIGWKEVLGSVVLTAASFSIALSLQGVTDYPFSLGWSEGNRLWDYSTFFGSSLYDYPPEQKIDVLSDPARLFVGGLPFLFPGITIEIERFWVGLTMIIPYFLVGMAAYRTVSNGHVAWLFFIFWIFLFLKQGPIYAPLVLSAALTILVWRRNLWISIPIVILAGYFAQLSRYTWMFAPGIWIGMLEFVSASLYNGKLTLSQWVRAIALGLAGVFGGYLLPKMLPLLNREISVENVSAEVVSEQIANSGYTAEVIASEVSKQPLLWYRLLPNSTYENGILIGLLIAVLPLFAILIWLLWSRNWVLNIWQKIALAGSLLAFLVVGLVVSTKIGGGGDLHNMDMFLIGLAFTSIVAWYNGGREAILDSDQMSFWIKLLIIMLLVIPALGPLKQIRSFAYGERSAALAVLSDASSEKSLDLLPSDVKVDMALEEIKEAVAIAKTEGDILFLDQRQLLTFGYIANIPLVPDYEKKVLMNEALSGNAEYFKGFYADLASNRFSLIVSEKLTIAIKDSSFEFGEENNAWVTWVAEPILCYYEELSALSEVGVQLLVPKENANCQLP